MRLLKQSLNSECGSKFSARSLDIQTKSVWPQVAGSLHRRQCPDVFNGSSGENDAPHACRRWIWALHDLAGRRVPRKCAGPKTCETQLLADAVRRTAPLGVSSCKCLSQSTRVPLAPAPPALAREIARYEGPQVPARLSQKRRIGNLREVDVERLTLRARWSPPTQCHKLCRDAAAEFHQPSWEALRNLIHAQASCQMLVLRQCHAKAEWLVRAASAQAQRAIDSRKGPPWRHLPDRPARFGCNIAAHLTAIHSGSPRVCFHCSCKRKLHAQRVASWACSSICRSICRSENGTRPTVKSQEPTFELQH